LKKKSVAFRAPPKLFVTVPSNITVDRLVVVIWLDVRSKETASALVLLAAPSNIAPIAPRANVRTVRCGRVPIKVLFRRLALEDNRRLKGIMGGDVSNTGLELTPLSKPFKTREQAEKTREKYPERLRKRIGVGVIRIRSSWSGLLTQPV
jgi:hypothetical protein